MIAVLPTRVLLKRLELIADSELINEATCIAINEAIEVVRDVDEIAKVFNSKLSETDKLKAIEKIMFSKDREWSDNE